MAHVDWPHKLTFLAMRSALDFSARIHSHYEKVRPQLLVTFTQNFCYLSTILRLVIKLCIKVVHSQQPPINDCLSLVKACQPVSSAATKIVAISQRSIIFSVIFSHLLTTTPGQSGPVCSLIHTFRSEKKKENKESKNFIHL